MSLLTILTTVLAGSAAIVSAAPTPENEARAPFPLSCYPALNFQKPLLLPPTNENWWCDPSTEYAFLGFSYEVTACA